MSVDQSGGLSMEIGVLYLSHAMLVLTELIVCSTRRFACILTKWFWSTLPHVNIYFGRRSASLMKEFWILCILLMTDSETVMVETIPYSNIGLTHCL